MTSLPVFAFSWIGRGDSPKPCGTVRVYNILILALARGSTLLAAWIGTELFHLIVLEYDTLTGSGWRIDPLAGLVEYLTCTFVC